MVILLEEVFMLNIRRQLTNTRSSDRPTIKENRENWLCAGHAAATVLVAAQQQTQSAHLEA